MVVRLSEVLEEPAEESSFDPQVKAGVVGCGWMGRERIEGILADFEHTTIPVVCEPHPEAYEQTVRVFQVAGKPPPVNVPHLGALLDECASDLDAVYILTPHALHFRQAKACMEAGLDVLVEKPMVVNAREAADIVSVRDRTGRMLVVAYQGSLSPHVRSAARMIRSGEIGPIQTISGVIWQDWGGLFTEDSWRVNPEMSGGGFVFDSGAHLLNTVSDLAGEEFAEVWALFDYQQGPVEKNAVIMGRLRSGVLVSLHACGTTAPSAHSDIKVFCTRAILRAGAWGEFLEVWRHPDYWEERDRGRQPGWRTVEVRPSRGVWEEFLSARAGLIENPSPPELGLRTALLWDAIKESAARDGASVRPRTLAASG